MNKDEIRQFFATQKKPLQTVNMGGKSVKLSNFPKEVRDKIMTRLAEQDPVLNKAIETTKFGIKIDGIEVGSDNIKEFEIKPSEVKVEEKPLVETKEVVKYTGLELKAMNKSKQTEILKGFEVKKIPTLEKDRINMILDLQLN